MDHTSQLIVFEQGIPEVSEILAQLGWSEHSPFITIVTDEKSIKIEHIRDLQAELGMGTPEPRLVLITPGEKITLPAQQALLKLLEEPPENTLLAIPVRSPQALLPTIQSRCVVVRVGRAEKVANQTPLWTDWSSATSLREKVELAQQYAGKREEVQAVLQQELHGLLQEKTTPESIKFRQRLLESLEALQGNVSPQLCLERLLLL